jgi:hypothetical protein
MPKKNSEPKQLEQLGITPLIKFPLKISFFDISTIELTEIKTAISGILGLSAKQTNR